MKKPTEENNCENCDYSDVSLYAEPCIDCVNEGCWRPKGWTNLKEMNQEQCTYKGCRRSSRFAVLVFRDVFGTKEIHLCKRHLKALKKMAADGMFKIFGIKDMKKAVSQIAPVTPSTKEIESV